MIHQKYPLWLIPQLKAVKQGRLYIMYGYRSFDSYLNFIVNHIFDKKGLSGDEKREVKSDLEHKINDQWHNDLQSYAHKNLN